MIWIVRVQEELFQAQMFEAAGGVLVMPKAGPRLLWQRQMGTSAGLHSSGANGCVCLRRGRWALLQTPARQPELREAGKAQEKRFALLSDLEKAWVLTQDWQAACAHAFSISVSWVMWAELGCLDNSHPTPLLLPEVTSSTLWWFHFFGVTFFLNHSNLFYTYSRKFLFYKDLVTWFYW